jgi:glutaredoxin
MISGMSRALLLLLLVAPLAWAQQYRWVDEQGKVHYTDTPPPASAKSAQKKDFKPNELGQQPNFQLTQAIKSSPVTLYTHSDCKEPCQVARDVLNKRGVPFKEISVVSQQQLEELKRVSGEITVPVMLIGGQIEKNATAAAFNQALDIAGYPAAGVVPPRQQAPTTAEKAGASAVGTPK